MKTKTLYQTTTTLLAMFLIILIAMNGCSKDDDPDPIDEPIETSDITVFNIKNQAEAGWNFLSVAKDGGYLIIKENEKNGLPTEAFFRPIANHPGYSLKFDNNGYPQYAVVEDFIFQFCNFSGTKFDVAIIVPDKYVNQYHIDKYKIIRNIDAGVNIPELFANQKTSGTNWDWGKTLKIVSAGTSAMACGIGATAAVATGGFAIPLAVAGCGAVAVNAGLLPNKEILGVSPSTIGNVATIVGCVTSLDPPSKVGCALGLISIGTDIAQQDDKKIEEEPKVPLVWELLCNN